MYLELDADTNINTGDTWIVHLNFVEPNLKLFDYRFIEELKYQCKVWAVGWYVVLPFMKVEN